MSSKKVAQIKVKINVLRLDFLHWLLFAPWPIYYKEKDIRVNLLGFSTEIRTEQPGTDLSRGLAIHYKIKNLKKRMTHSYTIVIEVCGNWNTPSTTKGFPISPSPKTHAILQIMGWKINGGQGNADVLNCQEWDCRERGVETRECGQDWACCTLVFLSFIALLTASNV